MIISHKHKFIFIKTEKTAGTSIEIALSEICGPDDIITPISKQDEDYRAELGYRGKQHYIIPPKNYGKLKLGKLTFLLELYWRKKIMFYNHISATDIQKRIPEDIWNSYYKFCFERNPYDKIVSLYYWLGVKNGYNSILDYLKSGKPSKMRGFELYTEDAMPVVDKIYKFEELADSLKDISRVLNLEKDLVPPKKKAKGNTRKDKRSYQEILTNEERELISRIFAREIAYFDYKF